MAKIYANRILLGKMTIEEVPSRWREEVINIIYPALDERNEDVLS